MSQSRFAENFGFGLAAVQSREQGRHPSEGAARILLKVIDHESDGRPVGGGGRPVTRW
jgi:DNA-binding transcriptional regulator YiaG